MSEPSAFDELWEESRENLTWMSPYKGNRMIWNACTREAAKRIREAIPAYSHPVQVHTTPELAACIVESLLEEGE